MNGPLGTAKLAVQAPELDQSTLRDMGRLGEAVDGPARSQADDDVFTAEKGSAFYNRIRERSVMASEIAMVADLSHKGNGSCLLKAKCDRKATPGGRHAGKATIEDALAAFNEKRGTDSVLEEVGLITHPIYPFLRHQPDRVQIRPETALVSFRSCKQVPDGLSEEMEIEAIAGLAISEHRFFESSAPTSIILCIDDNGCSKIFEVVMGGRERYLWETYYVHSAVAFYKQRLLPRLLQVREAKLGPVRIEEAPPLTPAAADPQAPLTLPQSAENITSPSVKEGKLVLVHKSKKLRVIHKLLDDEHAILRDVGADAPSRARRVSYSAFTVVPVDEPVKPTRPGQRVIINAATGKRRSLIGQAATVVTFNYDFCEVQPEGESNTVRLKTAHLHVADALPAEGVQTVTVTVAPEEFLVFYRKRKRQGSYSLKDYTTEYIKKWIEETINMMKKQKKM